MNLNADVHHRLEDYPEDNDRARMLRYLMTRYRTVTLTAESGGPSILQDWKYELFGTWPRSTQKSVHSLRSQVL